MKHFYLNPSIVHFSLNLLIHSLVSLLVLVSSLTLGWKLLSLALCLASYRYAEITRARTTRYVSMHCDKGSFLLVDRSDCEWRAQLTGNFFSCPWLIILNLQMQNTEDHSGLYRQTITLYKDAMDLDQWRQLRVLLRTVSANPQ